VKVLFDCLKQQNELMLKYKDSPILEELEVYLLAKYNTKALREEIRKQIAFDSYWKLNYEDAYKFKIPS
jgi:hypothetical protein